MPEAIEPTVGDSVKVFGVLAGNVMHPEGGWDGEVVKVGTLARLPIVVIRFNGKQRERFYVRGQRHCGKTLLALRWRTLEQADVERRRNSAWKAIVDCGFDLIRPKALTVEQLEAAAKALQDISVPAGSS